MQKLNLKKLFIENRKYIKFCKKEKKKNKTKKCNVGNDALENGICLSATSQFTSNSDAWMESDHYDMNKLYQEPKPQKKEKKKKGTSPPKEKKTKMQRVSMLHAYLSMPDVPLKNPSCQLCNPKLRKWDKWLIIETKSLPK